MVTQMALHIAPHQAAVAALQESAAQGQPPPPLHAPSLRTALHCALPPALTKVQHPHLSSWHVN